MYPKDGLCHYLFYTHVFIYENETKEEKKPPIITVASSRIVVSFNVFKQQILKYKKTEGGLSFDVRAVDHGRVFRGYTTVRKLQEEKLLHFGFLNIIDRPGALEGLVTSAVATCGLLKNIQANSTRRRIVVAIGSIDYSTPRHWAMFKDALKEAAKKDSRIDTVIAVTSINSWLDKMGNCKCVPPAFIKGSNAKFPSLDKDMELVDMASEKLYGNRDVVVGLSLEMGAMMYTLKQVEAVPNFEAFLYKDCKAATLMPLDMGCESGSWAKVKDTNVAYPTGTQELVLLFDDLYTVNDKITFVLGKKRRRRFAWLYFDVHMADFRGSCGQEDPFRTIQNLRTNFSINDDPDQA